MACVAKSYCGFDALCRTFGRGVTPAGVIVGRMETGTENLVKRSNTILTWQQPGQRASRCRRATTCVHAIDLFEHPSPIASPELTSVQGILSWHWQVIKTTINTLLFQSFWQASSCGATSCLKYGVWYTFLSEPRRSSQEPYHGGANFVTTFSRVSFKPYLIKQLARHPWFSFHYAIRHLCVKRNT